MGMLLEQAQALGHPEYVQILNEDCKGEDGMLWHSLAVLPTLAAAFYAPFLFDIIGDSQGPAQGVTVLCIMIFVPLAFEILIRLREYFWVSRAVQPLTLQMAATNIPVNQIDTTDNNRDLHERQEQGQHGVEEQQRHHAGGGLGATSRFVFTEI